MTVKEIPEKIRIDLYEMNAMGDQLISEVLIPIPECSETSNVTDNQFKEIDFSGRNFSLNPSSTQSDTTGRWYTGKLSLNCFWGVHKDGSSLGPKKR